MCVGRVRASGDRGRSAVRFGTQGYVRCAVLQLLLMPGAAPGQCLPLDGSSGYVDIRLREPMLPAAITLQHIPASISFDVRSAPRKVLVIGYTAAPPLPRPGRGAAGAGSPAGTGDSSQQLAELTYDLQGPALQTFALHGASPISFVRVQVRLTGASCGYIPSQGFALGLGRRGVELWFRRRQGC